LHDARVAIAVGHEDVALGVPADVGRTIEALARDACADDRRCGCLLTAASACTRTTFAPSSGPARARRAGRRSRWFVIADVDRFRLAADRHQDAAVGIELHDDVRGLVDHPDVVLGIDAYDVREHEAVDADADLADVRALVIELEQTRAVMREDPRSAERGGRRPGARVYEDVSLRVGGDARD